MADQFIDFTEKENVFSSFGIQTRQGVTYITMGFDSGDGQKVHIEMNALHFRKFQKELDSFITMFPSIQ